MTECDREFDLLMQRFTENLPGVDSAFAEGMMRYYKRYHEHRDRSIDCEMDPEYLTERSCILVADNSQYWYYAPHFRQTAADAIETLFRTPIVEVKGSYRQFDSSMCFVDLSGNQWNFDIVREDESTRIYALLPRFRTLHRVRRRRQSTQTTNEESSAQCSDDAESHGAELTKSWKC
jgi:hypothetical protein